MRITGAREPPSHCLIRPSTFPSKLLINTLTNCGGCTGLYCRLLTSKASGLILRQGENIRREDLLCFTEVRKHASYVKDWKRGWLGEATHLGVAGAGLQARHQAQRRGHDDVGPVKISEQTHTRTRDLHVVVPHRMSNETQTTNEEETKVQVIGRGPAAVELRAVSLA